MRRVPHLLRDVVLLTLPLMGLFVWLWIAALASFWNAEIRCFHGELVRDLRVGTLRTMIQASTRGLLHPRKRRYLPIKRAPADNPVSAPGVDVFDLRVDGKAIDALAADLPASARVRQKGTLDTGPETFDVDVTWRGQRMENYFFARRAWKLRLKKREFVEDLRILNLTPLEDRLPSLVTFAAARAIGLPAPETRIVQLYVNLEDQGTYLLEEQVDESMVRRTGSMPGDVFYGELFVPDVPTSSSWDLFWNPYLWEKHDRWNKYPEEHRPWLSDLLDATCDPSPAGFARLDELLDPTFPRWLALLCFQGDQHVDQSHNWKLHFNLLSSRFECMVWNPLLNMPEGQGVETTANRLFRRLEQDPRFVDRVQRIVHDELLTAGVARAEIAELDRVEAALAAAGHLGDNWLAYAIRAMRTKVERREQTVAAQHAIAEASFTQDGGRLALFATSVASLRLAGLELAGDAAGIVLLEDRDFDGVPSPADREVATRADGSRLRVLDETLVPVGRDFTAAWNQRPSEGQDTFQQHREFTRLAALRSDYLLARAGRDATAAPASARAPVPRVARVELARTIGAGDVTVREGAPTGLVATECVHPWTVPPPPPPRVVELSGEARLASSLLLHARDQLRIAPGTKVLLGPGVSLQVRSRVEWRDVSFERLDPGRPFGVIALQEHGCDGSVLERCTVDGGSEAVIGHTYYSGMFSAHLVDGLRVRDCRFANNLLGDDTVRLGLCHDVVFERVRVENAIADAVDFDLCQGVIRDSVIVRPINDGMDMMTGRVDLERLEVIGAGDKGVSVGEGSHPKITDCVFRECVTGIGIKDGSDPVVTNALIEGCRTGVSSYDKNWRYPGGGLGRLVDCTLRGNEVDVKLDDASTLTLERCRTERKFKLPKDGSGRLLEIPPPSAAGSNP